MSSRVACSRGDRLSALIGRAPLTLDRTLSVRTRAVESTPKIPPAGTRVTCVVCPQRPRTSHGPARRARETANDLEF